MRFVMKERWLLGGLMWLTGSAAGIPGAAAEGDAEAWKRAAAERIREHRMGELTVRVYDAAGDPVEGVEVDLAMQRHAFMWGSALGVNRLLEEPEDSPYRRNLVELFNTTVFENAHKWKLWENPEKRAKADEALAWVQAHGLRLRAHTMLWQTFKYGVPMPKDVEIAIREDRGRDFVRERTLERIRESGAQLRGIAEEWDVVNEQVTEHEITRYLHPDAPVAEVPALVEWFAAAHAAAPDARLFLNDFHILVGDDPQQKETYEATIRHLLDNGAPLGGIGFQGHFHGADLKRTPEQLWETLERFGQFGLPMVVTEYDTFGSGWGNTPEQKAAIAELKKQRDAGEISEEQLREKRKAYAAPRERKEAEEAEFLEQFLRTLFSHPQVTGIVFWGFWDGQHWTNNAPFFRQDWSEKPALGVYRDLVFREWWTREAGETNSAGEFSAPAFYGDYEVTLRKGGAESRATIRFRKDASTFSFRWDPE